MQVERDGLSQAIFAECEGDVLVVWKLDRLGRSLGFLGALHFGLALSEDRL